MMNTKLVASLAILVLVIGVGSQMLTHSAEAKGMPKCWLNSDGTVKAGYLHFQHTTSKDPVYPKPIGKTYCSKQGKDLT